MNNLQKLLFEQLHRSPSIKRLHDQVHRAKPGKPFPVKGLRGAALSAAVAELAVSESLTPEDRPPVIMLITGNYERSGELYDDLGFFGVEEVHHYPRTQLLPYDDDEPLLEEQVKHLEFLRFLSEKQGGEHGCSSSRRRNIH